MKEKDPIFKLCDTIRQTSFELQAYHRHGHLEKIYENALSHRLRKMGIDVQQQYPLKVYDEDGTALGEYFADIVVSDIIIVEIKACRALAPEHTAQLLGYMRSARTEHGMLINFGAPKLEVRKFALSA